MAVWGVRHPVSSNGPQRRRRIAGEVQPLGRFSTNGPQRERRSAGEVQPLGRAGVGHPISRLSIGMDSAAAAAKVLALTLGLVAAVASSTQTCMSACTTTAMGTSDEFLEREAMHAVKAAARPARVPHVLAQMER